MAVEDGKMAEMDVEFFKQLIEGRYQKWSEMMAALPAKGYTVVDLREEGGFTSRLAIRAPHEGAARGCFIICAGGAFMFKSWNEAEPVADFFYEKGINVAILDYHVGLGGNGGIDYEAARMAGDDGLMAVRYLRAHAAEYGILPDHIAIGGFSAGGMLSGYVATKFDAGDPTAADPVLQASSRPDAALILYGAFSTTSFAPAGPGGMTPAEIAAAVPMDTVRNIRPECPPMFIFQTHGDDPRIGLNFAWQLACSGVPYEIHTFEDGPHGGGLYNGLEETPDEPHTALWAGIAADWLTHRGF